MKQPTTEFWMETRARTRKASSSTIPKKTNAPAHHTPSTKKKVYVLVPTSPYPIPGRNISGKGQFRQEVEVSDDEEESPFQTKSAMDSLLDVRYTIEHEDTEEAGELELRKRPYNIHPKSQGRANTDEIMEDLVKFRENHERYLKHGVTIGESAVSIATEPFGVSGSQRTAIRADLTTRQIPHNTTAATSRGGPTNPLVASSRTDPSGGPLPLNRLSSLASVVPTEIVDQDKLRQQWVEHQSTHPPSEGPALPNDIIHAERSEMLRRYIQEQSEW
ncbi:hypothetical protein JR316_0009810 [Psilocybe cubensis]|uniref:Uncharacterized protein n=2 Tax=Psilocybe cubensis TaxID=181762 RepID=A0A8H8CFZ9_PSICU|nr:hypothetical protein JR316_0009810 [Psilocybe cubensis]KAH9477588.1 hypothetical protein JR316_0009810 [Psilocybe cubensis]